MLNSLGSWSLEGSLLVGALPMAFLSMLAWSIGEGAEEGHGSQELCAFPAIF